MKPPINNPGEDDDCPATTMVPVLRLDGGEGRSAPDLVVCEQPATLMVEGIGSFTILCTPTDLGALAAGFAFSEGLIESMDDIVQMTPVRRAESGGPVIGMRLERPPAARPRNTLVVSSCGLCGSRNVEQMLRSMPPCPHRLRFPRERMDETMAQLRERQAVFSATGGCHAAGLFDSTGRMVAVAEDIGRHSAFDKAVGKLLLARELKAPLGAALSGRVSLEIVAKAARAGIELILAVSAPSSLAVTAAQQWQITLCGFVRPGRANVYAHPERLSGFDLPRPAAPEKGGASSCRSTS